MKTTAHVFSGTLVKYSPPSAPHPCEPFGKAWVPTFLPLLLSPTPTPQLTLADHTHICA